MWELRELKQDIVDLKDSFMCHKRQDPRITLSYAKSVASSVAHNPAVNLKPIQNAITIYGSQVLPIATFCKLGNVESQRASA